MITWTQGDLFTIGVPDLAHGCNCKGVMDAGIAAQFRQRWPLMFEFYRRRCASDAFRPGDAMPWKHPGGVVFNLATQDAPGPGAQPWMITAAVGRMIQLAPRMPGGVSRVAMPWIGCGIGGLSRDDLHYAIEPYQDAPVDLIVVEWKAPA